MNWKCWFFHDWAPWQRVLVAVNRYNNGVHISTNNVTQQQSICTRCNLLKMKPMRIK